MDPTQREGVTDGAMQRFLTQLVEGAQDRQEVIHFVTARQMVNIIWAACDGREGNPGDYRDYHLKLACESSAEDSPKHKSAGERERIAHVRNRGHREYGCR